MTKQSTLVFLECIDCVQIEGDRHTQLIHPHFFRHPIVAVLLVLFVILVQLDRLSECQIVILLDYQIVDRHLLDIRANQGLMF